MHACARGDRRGHRPRAARAPAAAVRAAPSRIVSAAADWLRCRAACAAPRGGSIGATHLPSSYGSCHPLGGRLFGGGAGHFRWGVITLRCRGSFGGSKAVIRENHRQEVHLQARTRRERGPAPPGTGTSPGQAWSSFPPSQIPATTIHRVVGSVPGGFKCFCSVRRIEAPPASVNASPTSRQPVQRAQAVARTPRGDQKQDSEGYI
jgi:hypothetical protein